MNYIPRQSGKYDILLVHPYAYAPKTRFVPMGLLSIASQLDAKGFEVKVVDLQIHPKTALYESLKDLKEDGIVGFGGASEGRFQVFEYSRHIKNLLPDVKVIYGGPHATFTSDLTLKRIDSIDVIVCGEGEITMLELAEHFLRRRGKLEEIKGISYKNSAHIERTPNRERIKNLDSLVYNFPKFVDYKDYGQTLFLKKGKGCHFITSRGCFALCNFCAARAMWTSITAHSAVRTLDEIEKIFAENPEFDGLFIADSIFTFTKRHVLSICDEIKRRNLSFLWICDIRTNTVDYDLLERMKEAGCYSVNFGFESASPRILKEVIGKGTTPEEAIKVFEWATSLDMYTIFNVTYGHPTETYEEALYTLEYLKDYQSNYVRMLDPQPLRIYPGTRLEQYAIENNLLPPGFDWCVDYDSDPGLKRSTPYIPILIQPQLGIKEFKKLQEVWMEMNKYLPPIHGD